MILTITNTDAGAASSRPMLLVLLYHILKIHIYYSVLFQNSLFLYVNYVYLYKDCQLNKYNHKLTFYRNGDSREQETAIGYPKSVIFIWSLLPWQAGIR